MMKWVWADNSVLPKVRGRPTYEFDDQVVGGRLANVSLIPKIKFLIDSSVRLYPCSVRLLGSFCNQVVCISLFTSTKGVYM